jgi:hypothetical protein
VTEQEWLTDPGPFGPHRQFFFVERQADRRRLLLFGSACCRRVWDLLGSGAARRLVELAEAWADGAATEEDLLAVNGSSEFSDMGAQSQGEAEPERQLSARVVDAINATRKLVDPFESAFTYSIARKTSGAPGADFVPDPSSGFGLNRILPRDDGEWAVKVRILRDIFGNPFHPVNFDPTWRTSTAVALANQMYQSRDFAAMPILADALQDAGCDNEDILSHCREPGVHVRGCWVVDLVLGKQ